MVSAEGLTVTLDGQPAEPGDLTDGMLVQVTYSGEDLYTYPMGMSGVTALKASTQDGRDLAALYLRVLDDLWAFDPALQEKIEYVAVDLCDAPGLAPGEKSAICWLFGGQINRGREKPVQIIPDTGLSELRDSGFLTELEDSGLFFWEDGVLLTIEKEEPEPQDGALHFSACKWRSPDGAALFEGCTARWSEAGGWQYEPEATGLA